MNNIVVSIGIKKGIVAILINQNGMIRHKVVERIKDDNVSSSCYRSIIYAFTKSLRLVRQYMSEHKEVNSVCFVTSNSIFIKWVNEQYSKEAYQEEFTAAMQLLQELPIKYALSFNARPDAVLYTSEEYIEKEKLSGLDLPEMG